MKNLVAKTLLLFISLCISLNVLTVEVIAANLSQYTSYPLSNTFIVQEDLQGSKEIVPYADIVGWRYKTVDGDQGWYRDKWEDGLYYTQRYTSFYENSNYTGFIEFTDIVNFH